MKKAYYLFNPGRMSRHDNTLKFTPVDEKGVEGEPRHIPLEGVDNLYCFGSLDANSALYNFLGQNGVGVHFFDYYEHYTGSFQPKEYLLAGKVHVEQARTYLTPAKRLHLARGLVDGASFNMTKNLRYYQNRGKALEPQIETIERYRADLDKARSACAAAAGSSLARLTRLPVVSCSCASLRSLWRLVSAASEVS